MVDKVLFSSDSTEWETPQELFDQLNKEFNFEIDVCATYENKKCNNWLGYGPGNIFTDGLKHNWGDMVCWMNPPYGEPEIPCVTPHEKCNKKRCKPPTKDNLTGRGFHITEYIPGVIDWVKKAYEESLKGATVVCLLPARTDTKWFHNWVLGKAEIRFIRGRLKFVGAPSFAPFPSILAIYKGFESIKAVS